MPEIHAHDTSAWHLADIAHRYGDIYDIRFEIFQRKFFIKFLNNFINQLTPFFFYSIGGYLVIKGSISFGLLVAVLAAYKDLAGPWKELLDDTDEGGYPIKYEQVIEQFDLPELMPAPDRHRCRSRIPVERPHGSAMFPSARKRAEDPGQCHLYAAPGRPYRRGRRSRTR